MLRGWGISMNSCRAAVLVAASVLMVLSASAASACSCGRSSAKDKFAEADLVVKGRMKLVTFGVEIPDPRSEGEVPRLTRGDFEVDKVLKGTFKGKTLSVYTGAGMGDCGRLGISSTLRFTTTATNSAFTNSDCRRPNLRGRHSILRRSVTMRRGRRTVKSRRRTSHENRGVRRRDVRPPAPARLSYLTTLTFATPSSMRPDSSGVLRMNLSLPT